MSDKLSDDLFEDVEYGSDELSDDLFEDVEYGSDELKSESSTESKMSDNLIDKVLGGVVGGVSGGGAGAGAGYLTGKGAEKLTSRLSESGRDMFSTMSHNVGGTGNTVDTLTRLAEKHGVEIPKSSNEVGRDLFERKLIPTFTKSPEKVGYEFKELLEKEPTAKNKFLKEVVDEYMVKGKKDINPNDIKASAFTKFGDRIQGSSAVGLDKMNKLGKKAPKFGTKLGSTLGALLGGTIGTASAMAAGEDPSDALSMTASEGLTGLIPGGVEDLGAGSDIVSKDTEFFKQSPEEFERIKKDFENKKLERPNNVNGIYKASPEDLEKAALMSSEVLEGSEGVRVSNLLNNIAKSEPKKRNALLFSAMQDPNLRQSLKKVIPEDE